jgi:HK97 family phage major capsid protein
MNTAQLLKERREEYAAKKAELDALEDKIAKRTWDDKTDKPVMDAISAELRSMESQIDALNTKLETEARSAAYTSTATTSSPVTVNLIEKRGDKIEDVQNRFHFADAIRTLVEVRQGGKMDGLVREMHEEATKEANNVGLRDFGQGIMIPSFIQQRRQPGFHKRDMSTTTTDGGYTIQTEVGQLIPYLDPQGIISRLGVKFMPGLVGNIDFPRIDGTTTAVWAAEQAASTESNPTTDRVQMSPNRLTAWSDFSTQLLRQSSINVENLVRERLMNARDNALDSAALNGGGGTTPTGITGVSGVNVITVAASPTWAKIVDFESQVAADDALNGSAIAYLTTPSIAGLLKTIKRDVAGNGFIWEGNNQGGGSINGYRALTSSLVPTGGGGHYMFFGDWSRMKVGQWGGSELMLDPYTGLTTATMRIVLNTWHDIAIEQGKAFSYSATVHPS